MAKTQKQLVADIEKNVEELDRDLKTHLKYEFGPTIKTLKEDIQALKDGAETYVLVKDFKPFADGIIWTIRIVMGAVIMAMLAIVFGKTTK